MRLIICLTLLSGVLAGTGTGTGKKSTCPKSKDTPSVTHTLVHTTSITPLSGLRNTTAYAGTGTGKKSICPKSKDTPTVTYTSVHSTSISPLFGSIRTTTDYDATEYVTVPTSIYCTITETSEVDVATGTTSYTYTIYTSINATATTTVSTTPCGFTPIKREPEYTASITTVPGIYVKGQYVVTTVSHPGTTTSTIGTDDCGTPSRTTVTTTTTHYYVKENDVFSTSTWGPTVTSYAACKPNNIARHGPQGGVIADYRILKGPALDHFPRAVTPGMTATAEDCCNFCQSLPICYGSSFQYYSLYSPNNTCYAWVPYAEPICNITGAAINFAAVPENRYPYSYLAVSNGNCGQITPLLDNDPDDDLFISTDSPPDGPYKIQG